MKEIFLFILLLFPCLINSYIGKRSVDMDTSIPISLYVSINYDTYFYVEIGDFNSGYLYLHLTDNSYGLKDITYCISTSNPLYPDTITNCYPRVPMTHYNLKTSGDTKEYYYKVNITTSEKRGRCIVFKYKGTDPTGSLTAKSSLSDLYRDTKTSNSNTTLPPFAVALLVICAVFSLVSSIMVIIFFCKIKKATGGFSNGSFPLIQNNNS